MALQKQELAERGNHDVAGKLLAAKMGRLQADDERTLHMHTEIPVTMAPESSKAGSTSQTMLGTMTSPIGAKSSVPTMAPTTIAPTIIETEPARKRPASTTPMVIGAKSSKDRKVPAYAKTLPDSDIVWPYDDDTSDDEHEEVKEEYEDVGPTYGTNDADECQFQKVSKGSVRSAGR